MVAHLLTTVQSVLVTGQQLSQLRKRNAEQVAIDDEGCKRKEDVNTRRLEL